MLRVDDFISAYQLLWSFINTSVVISCWLGHSIIRAKGQWITTVRIGRCKNRSVNGDHRRLVWAIWFWKINELLGLIDLIFITEDGECSWRSSNKAKWTSHSLFYPLKQRWLAGMRRGTDPEVGTWGLDVKNDPCMARNSDLYSNHAEITLSQIHKKTDLRCRNEWATRGDAGHTESNRQVTRVGQIIATSFKSLP